MAYCERCDRDHDDDPIILSVSSGYGNDPLAFNVRCSGKTEPMYPETRASFDTYQVKAKR